MQKNMFFILSIRENLQLIAPEASEEDLIAALKAARLYDFVDSLPQKIDPLSESIVLSCREDRSNVLQSRD